MATDRDDIPADQRVWFAWPALSEYRERVALVVAKIDSDGRRWRWLDSLVGRRRGGVTRACPRTGMDKPTFGHVLDAVPLRSHEAEALAVHLLAVQTLIVEGVHRPPKDTPASEREAQ